MRKESHRRQSKNPPNRKISRGRKKRKPNNQCCKFIQQTRDERFTPLRSNNMIALYQNQIIIYIQPQSEPKGTDWVGFLNIVVQLVSLGRVFW
jgi:hypothetical protein